MVIPGGIVSLCATNYAALSGGTVPLAAKAGRRALGILPSLSRPRRTSNLGRLGHMSAKEKKQWNSGYRENNYLIPFLSTFCNDTNMLLNSY